MVTADHPQRIRTLVFDWDGTLHNTLHLYGSAVRSVYRELADAGEAPEHYYSDEDLSIYLGMNAQDMWASFMPELPETRRAEMSRKVGEYMISLISAGKTSLYPGTEAVLERLRSDGFRMALLSNCTIAYMQAHREHFHLDRWFDGYYPCEAWDNASKEEIFPEIRRSFEGDFCVIGDRESDLRVASVHNLSSIACTWGFGRPCEYEGADVCIGDITKLPEAISGLQRSRIN